MLNDYLDSLESKKEETVELNLSRSALFNPDAVINTLSNISNMSERELYNFLKLYYDDVLNIVINRHDLNLISVFNNSKFVSSFIQVISSLREISYTQKIYCNKIAYDYIIIPTGDEYIKQLFISLSRIVNRDIIPGLVGIGLSDFTACYIALARYSSQKETTNIKRVNFILITSSIEIMTEQMVVWIYEKLFDRVTPLFNSIMSDTYTENDGYTEDMEQIYSIISLAILDILENMPSSDIRSILIDYSMSYKTDGRFSLRTLGPDYPRINNIVQYLNEDEQIYVP